MNYRYFAAAIIAIFVFAASAFAQGAGAPPAQPGIGEVFMRMIPMFIMVFFIFYFMVMKPQQAKLRAHRDLLESLKKNDAVVTSGGVIGKVAGVEGDHVLVEVAQNVRVRFERQAIAKRIDAIVVK